MNKQIKICFIGKYSTSFIKKDCDILKKHFDVHIIDTADYKWKFFKGIRVIFTEVKNCDITFSWFAGDHAPQILTNKNPLYFAPTQNN